MDNLLDDLHRFPNAPTPEPWEDVYTAPFRVVNAAVFHALSTNMIHVGLLHHDGTEGARRYIMVFPDGQIIWLFVLERGESLTSIRAHPFVPYGKLESGPPELEHAIANILGLCHVEIARAMEYVERRAPPMPKYGRDGWGSVFWWKEHYAPDMPDDELAAAQNVSLQTLYNAHSKRYAHLRDLPALEVDKKKRKKSE